MLFIFAELPKFVEILFFKVEIRMQPPKLFSDQSYIRIEEVKIRFLNACEELIIKKWSGISFTDKGWVWLQDRNDGLGVNGELTQKLVLPFIFPILFGFQIPTDELNITVWVDADFDFTFID